MLGVRVGGAGPPLVALHGFTHTGAQFDDLVPHLGRSVIALDLPGHGTSADRPTAMASVIDDVVDTVRALVAGPVPMLGYSQGARVGFGVAAEHPELIAAFVAVSGTPGIADDGARDERSHTDRVLAERIRAIGIDAFVDEWTGSGLTSTTHRPADRRSADRARRLENTAEGLAHALTGFGQGASPSRWDALDRMSMPVLLVTGQWDSAYSEIARDAATRLPASEVAVVADAGHDPIGDRPEEVGRLVSAFLDRHC